VAEDFGQSGDARAPHQAILCRFSRKVALCRCFRGGRSRVRLLISCSAEWLGLRGSYSTGDALVAAGKSFTWGCWPAGGSPSWMRNWRTALGITRCPTVACYGRYTRLSGLGERSGCCQPPLAGWAGGSGV